jgi:prefoldin beta subunit
MHVCSTLIRSSQEFTLLKPHNTVYKLVGPSLVPQEQAEAKTNVEKRLEYIKAEM